MKNLSMKKIFACIKTKFQSWENDFNEGKRNSKAEKMISTNENEIPRLEK